MVSQEIDIENANELYENSKGFQALQVLSPCLKAKSANEFVNLEKCLYLGEQIACTIPCPYQLKLKLDQIEYDDKYWDKYYSIIDSVFDELLSIGDRTWLCETRWPAYLSPWISRETNNFISEFLFQVVIAAV